MTASNDDWALKAANLGRDGYVVLPDALSASQLDVLRAFAAAIPLEHKADYPDAERDVGFATSADAVYAVVRDSPVLPILRHFLGAEPVLVTLWQRTALGLSRGGVWHQDLQREYWPPAINVAIYLDSVTPDNGPTLVVPGTHLLPHPKFDRARQPRETAVLGRAGTVAMFLATVWHRGSANMTSVPRRALFSYYRSVGAVRVRRPPDPRPGEGWELGDPGLLNEHWSS